MAEGAKPIGGSFTVREAARAGYVERLGGVGIVLAEQLEEMTGAKRAASCSATCSAAADRPRSIACWRRRFGGAAVELIQRGVFGKMVANNPPDIVPIPLADVVGRTKTVPLDSDLIKTARAIGVALGD